jgi:hypothetical protein
VGCLEVTRALTRGWGRLRELVPATHAIVGTDLADAKQMVVVTDHRWCNGGVRADRALVAGARASRRRARHGVSVQALISSWARRAEDLAHDKTDLKDAVLLARLTAQLRCYAPEPVDETWARLPQPSNSPRSGRRSRRWCSPPRCRRCRETPAWRPATWRRKSGDCEQTQRGRHRSHAAATNPHHRYAGPDDAEGTTQAGLRTSHADVRMRTGGLRCAWP